MDSQVKPHQRRRPSRQVRVSAIAAAATVAILISQALPASALTISMTPSATLAYGQGRGLSAAWLGTAPFKVTFLCNISGCANWVVNSTTAESLGGRWVSAAVCAGQVRTSTITVWDQAGAGTRGDASTTTTWRPGC